METLYSAPKQNDEISILVCFYLTYLKFIKKLELTDYEEITLTCENNNLFLKICMRKILLHNFMAGHIAVSSFVFFPLVITSFFIEKDNEVDHMECFS